VIPRPASPRRSALLLAAGLLGLAADAAAERAVMFMGTWGPAGARQGRVYRYESGTSWTELSPPAGLADAVWDLEWIDGELWAATHDGQESPRDSSIPHGDAGHVYRHDGATWVDMSPAGGFPSAVTTVTTLDGDVFITVDTVGLLRWNGGASWSVIGSFTLGAQALVSDSHLGRPMLYLGQDNTDEFWFHDPSGSTSCGAVMPGCQDPGGTTCSAGCFPGSCIHALAEFDDGTGPRVYAGAWIGQMYRWDGTDRFERIDNVPDAPYPDERFNHVQGLASYRGRLWLGLSDGRAWSTADGTAPTYRVEQDFGLDEPFSDLLAVPEDDLLWAAFGAVPWRWARDDGASMVRTFDGAAWRARDVLGAHGAGVLALLAVLPEIRCDAGPAQAFECAPGEIEVALSGTASDVPPVLGLTTAYAWTGPFLEGVASGPSPTVHFAGAPAVHDVFLTVEAGSASGTCRTTVTISDTRPPVIAGQDACLWPPNHRYRCFDVSDFTAAGTGTALDECSGEVVVRIVGAALSSQPEDQTPGGDGHTQDDLLFDEQRVCVRSERLGVVQEGRTYTITLEATDGAGNVTVETASLHVPHDQRVARRCERRSHDVGLLPHAPLPLGPASRREGSYPPPSLRPR
jgi:hypothetical protein